MAPTLVAARRCVQCHDGTTRIWDATSRQIGWWVELLPAGEVARCGAIDRLPAETFSPLPPL